MVDSILSTGAMAYHFGNSIDIEDMLKRIPEDTVVMGNIDPAGSLRLGTPESISSETKALIARCRKYPHFLISSGCDIPPATPWENLDAFFSAVEDAHGD
jgi:uroporphyrinogen decarboxylase